MAQLYDLMMLLDAAAPQERRHEIVADVREMVDEGGTLTEAHDWGNQRLAYEIDHRPDADYQLLRFEGGNELLDRLDSSLSIMDGVLRFRIIKQKHDGPPVPDRPEAVGAGAGDDEEPESRVAARAAADAAPDADDAPADEQ